MPRTPATTTAPTLPGGITAAQRDALLAEIAADPTGAKAAARELTPREAVIASFLRERDHLDGCPAIRDDNGEARLDNANAMVEAYEETAVAPAPALRSLGAVPGSPIVVVRCIRCAGSRYFVSPAPPHVRTGEGRHVQALITETLTAAAASDGELDTTL